MGLFEKLMRGQDVHVQVPDSGRQFTIRTKRYAGVTGYKVIHNGKVDPNFKGWKILDRATVQDWCSRLLDLGA